MTILPHHARTGRPRKDGDRYPSGGLRPAPSAIDRMRGARRAAAREQTTEERLGMTLAQATALIGQPSGEWFAYAFAPIGDVCNDIEILRAARLLYELGLATLAQLRTENATFYMIKSRKQ